MVAIIGSNKKTPLYSNCMQNGMPQSWIAFCGVNHAGKT